MATFILLIMIIVGILVYFLPSVIAHQRKHKKFTAILILNIFLGWTIIGWVGTLIWAFVD